ncbi:MAG: hypothetical protein COZ05_21270, partial [Armatimonadetes bacterium CG_4_10_14_3_um_filter_59_10]
MRSAKAGGCVWVFALLLFLYGSATAQIPVHQSFTLKPKEANPASNVQANGARYRFTVNLDVVSSDANWLYSAQWKYERASLQWILPNVGDDWVAETDEAHNYIRSYVWQTPNIKQSFAIRVKGKRWPLTSGGGGGTYNPNWESEWSGNVEANAVTITNPDASTTIAVPKGTSTVIEAAVANNGGDNLAGVPVTFNHQDPEPQNAAADSGFGANRTASTTTNTDAAGAALAEFTVSSVAGDDHVVTAQTDNSNVANSGRIIAVDIGDPGTTTYLIDLYSDVAQVQADGEHSANLTATVTANGLPAKGVQVSFTTTLGTLGQDVVVTNNDGQATVSLTPENGVTGTATVTASVATVAATATVEFTDGSVPLDGIFVSFVYPSSGVITGASIQSVSSAGAKAASIVVTPPTAATVTGDSIPVVAEVRLVNTSNQYIWYTWQYCVEVDGVPVVQDANYWLNQCSGGLGVTVYPVVFGWNASAYPSKEHTITVKARYGKDRILMPGEPGPPNVEQGYKVASRSVNLDNNPIILKGPEPVRTVCDPPAPGNPGPGNCR